VNQNNKESLAWETDHKNKTIYDLLEPIVRNFILIVEAEQQRTVEQLKQTEKNLEKMRK